MIDTKRKLRHTFFCEECGRKQRFIHAVTDKAERLVYFVDIFGHWKLIDRRS
jgi:transposase